MSDFLWTLACADPALLRHCGERVQTQFTWMGAGVGLIGLVTGLSGYYAAGLLFNQFHTTLIFGVLWGLMFTNLYRYMLVNVGFYDDLHKSHDGRRRPWGSVLLRAGLIGFFSFVVAQPVELFLLRNQLAPGLARAQARQRAQVQAGLQSRLRSDSLEAVAQLARLDSALAGPQRGLLQAQARRASYAANPDWRLAPARRAVQAQEQELTAQLAALEAAQTAKRAALATAANDRQAHLRAEMRAFEARQQAAGTLLLQIQILHRELPWAGVLTVLTMLIFLLPLVQRTFLQAVLGEFVRRNTWEETQVIKAAYSQFKQEYAAAMHQATGEARPWHDTGADPREREEAQKQQLIDFAKGTAGAVTGRLADQLRSFATVTPLPTP